MLLSCIQSIAEVPLDAVNSLDRNGNLDERRKPESLLNAQRAGPDLNRLKEIVIDSLDRVGRVRCHRHSEFDHEFSQL